MKRMITAVLTIIILIPSLAAAKVDFNKKVSLQFDGVSISTILGMVASKYKLNIVQSGQLDKEVTVKLDDVTLGDALKAILHSSGYNYYNAGDIIIVKSLEMNAIGELVTETVTLNYLSPASAVTAAQERLSSKGSIKVLEDTQAAGSRTGRKPSRVVITDLPEVVPIVVQLVKSLDFREPQVAIEVRMVEVNVTSVDRVGFSWPTQFSARVHGASEITESTQDESGTEALGYFQLPDGAWQWGRLSVEETRVMLEFLNQDGNSKLISDPRITTLNNHEAEIKVTTIVPIQTINRFSEGGAVQDIVTFQDEEVGITLKVIPHICEDSTIILEVQPTVAEIIGYSGPAESQKPITSERAINTRIMVKNGQTAVLGGLLKENNIETESKVFILGSIPILGHFFRHKTTQKSTTDLVIMITPNILED